MQSPIVCGMNMEPLHLSRTLCMLPLFKISKLCLLTLTVKDWAKPERVTCPGTLPQLALCRLLEPVNMLNASQISSQIHFSITNIENGNKLLFKDKNTLYSNPSAECR